MRFPEIDQYIADFEELVRRAGYTIGSEETISFFLNGLTPSILDAIIAPPFPETYQQHKAKAIQHTKARQMVEAIRARRGIPNNRPQNSFQQFRSGLQQRNWSQRPNNPQDNKRITLRTPHVPPTITSKSPWICRGLERQITNDSQGPTKPIQMELRHDFPKP
jgi:hypothetical protein